MVRMSTPKNPTICRSKAQRLTHSHEHINNNYYYYVLYDMCVSFSFEIKIGHMEYLLSFINLSGGAHSGIF